MPTTTQIFIPIFFYLPLLLCVTGISYFYYADSDPLFYQRCKSYLTNPKMLAPHKVQNDITNMHLFPFLIDGIKLFLPLDHLLFQNIVVFLQTESANNSTELPH